jgi:hypothetical protein
MREAEARLATAAGGSSQAASPAAIARRVIE